MRIESLVGLAPYQQQIQKLQDFVIIGAQKRRLYTEIENQIVRSACVSWIDPDVL
jgi:hypothetical protein